MYNPVHIFLLQKKKKKCSLYQYKMLRNEVISILRNLSCYKSNFMTLLYKTLPENIYFIINLRGENHWKCVLIAINFKNLNSNKSWDCVLRLWNFVIISINYNDLHQIEYSSLNDNNL